MRKTGSPLPMPLSIRAMETGLHIEFSEAVTTPEEELSDAFHLEGWNYRYSSNYGSPRLNLTDGSEGTTRLSIGEVTLSEDRRKMKLQVEGMKPAMQMDLDWSLNFGDLGSHSSFIHFTVHRLATEIKSR